MVHCGSTPTPLREGLLQNASIESTLWEDGMPFIFLLYLIQLRVIVAFGSEKNALLQRYLQRSFLNTEIVSVPRGCFGNLNAPSSIQYA